MTHQSALFPPAEQPPPFPSRPEASTAYIGVGKELHLTVFLSGPLTRQHLAGLIDGSLAIHVIGRAEYRDAFGERQHMTFNTFYGGRYGANENGVLTMPQMATKPHSRAVSTIRALMARAPTRRPPVQGASCA